MLIRGALNERESVEGRFERRTFARAGVEEVLFAHLPFPLLN